MKVKEYLQFGDRWKEFKRFLGIYKKYITRDRVDATMLGLNVVMVVLWAFGTDVSGFVGVTLVYIAGVIFRFGVATDKIKKVVDG